MTKSLLSKKDRERLSDAAQVQKLVRIGRRATCKAEWYEELAVNMASNLANPDFWTAEEEAQGMREGARETLVSLLADVPALRERARTAAYEALGIAERSDNLDLRRKARSVR